MKTTIARWGAAVLVFTMLSAVTETQAATLYLNSLFDPTFSDGRIEAVQTDGTGREVLREVGGGLRGLALDLAGGYLFWSDVDTDRIERVRLDEVTGVPAGVITGGLEFSQDLELSSSAERLFWADPTLEEVASSNLDDVNRDGLADLILRFKIRKTGIACGDTEVTLTGETFGGKSHWD